MSCGQPHATDCSEVLEKVYLYLDHEVQPVDFDKIRHHLDECAPCLKQYGLEQAVKSVVQRCCGADKAPETLRVSVMARIQQVRFEIDRAD
jgi:mycothiol system anti-sigma-R factor